MTNVKSNEVWKKLNEAQVLAAFVAHADEIDQEKGRVTITEIADLGVMIHRILGEVLEDFDIGKIEEAA